MTTTTTGASVVVVLTKRRAPSPPPLLNHPLPPPPLSDSSTVDGVTGAGMGVTRAVGGHYRARSGRGRRRREVAASRGANRLDVQSTDDTATVRVPPRERDSIIVAIKYYILLLFDPDRSSVPITVNNINAGAAIDRVCALTRRIL